MEKKLKSTLVCGAIFTFLMSLSSVALATANYGTQTSKACSYCHNTDFSLNAAGQKFKADGYKIVEAPTTDPVPTATLETKEKIKQTFTNFSTTVQIKQSDYVGKLSGVTFIPVANIGKPSTAYLTNQQAIYWGVIAGYKAEADKFTSTNVTKYLSTIADQSKISASYKKYVAYALYKKIVLPKAVRVTVTKIVNGRKVTSYVTKYYLYPTAYAKGASANAIIAKVAAYNPPLVGNDYVGSESCKTCHAGSYASWKSTPHSKMLQKIPRNADGTLAANYKDVVIVPDEAWAKQRTTSNTGGPIVQFTLDYIKLPGFSDGLNIPFAYTIASVHKQRFIVETKGKGNYMGWKILGQEYIIKDGSQGDIWQDYGGDKWKSWYICAGCHATGVKTTITPNADPKLKGTTNVTINELSIGCESCHGPAAKHVAAKGKKFSINTDGQTISLPYKSNNGYVCNACHNRGWNNYVTQDIEYIPNLMPWENNMTISETRFQEAGASLKATTTTKKFSGDGANAVFNLGESFDTTRVTVKVNGTATTDFTIQQPAAGTEHYTLPKIKFNAAPATGTDNIEVTYYGYNGATDFWGSNVNSHSKSHHQEYNDYKKSKHAKSGLTCNSCHITHNKDGAKLTFPQLKATGNQLCTQCHATKTIPANVTYSDKSCANCHMTGMAKSGVPGDIASHLMKPVLKGQFTGLPPAEKTLELDPALFTNNGKFHP